MYEYYRFNICEYSQCTPITALLNFSCRCTSIVAMYVATVFCWSVLSLKQVLVEPPSTVELSRSSLLLCCGGSLSWISAFNQSKLHCVYQNPSNRSSVVDCVT
jgi:hypothetical protein